MNKTSKLIIKYDGLCNLCTFWIYFIKKRDIDNKITYIDENNTKSIIVLINGVEKDKAEAIITILENIHISKIILYIIKKINSFFLKFNLSLLP